MSLPHWILSPDPSSAGLAAPPALRPSAEPIRWWDGSHGCLHRFRCSWAILNAAARRWIRVPALAGQRPHRPAVPLRILYRYHQHDPRGAEREPDKLLAVADWQQYAVQRKERLALAYAGRHPDAAGGG